MFQGYALQTKSHMEVIAIENLKEIMPFSTQTKYSKEQNYINTVRDS